MLWEENPDSEIYARFKDLAERGPAYTAYYRGRPVAVAGIALYWPGVGEAWAFLTRTAVTECKLSLHRAVKGTLATLVETYALRRVQAPVPAADPRRRRWIESLGFQLEGTLRLYGPDGSDFEMYSRVKED